MSGVYVPAECLIHQLREYGFEFGGESDPSVFGDLNTLAYRRVQDLGQVLRPFGPTARIAGLALAMAHLRSRRDFIE